MVATAAVGSGHDYQALTEGCALVDRSQRGKLTLTGPDAAGFLNGQLTNDITLLTPGSGCYAAFLTHKGKMLGDVRVLALDGPEPPLAAASAGEPDSTQRNGPQPPTEPPPLLLDCERVALQALFDTIRRFKVGYAVDLHKRTLQRALLSLLGLRSREVLERVRDGQDPQLPTGEHANATAHIAGTDVLLVATDAGWDLLCDATTRDAVAAALTEAGAQPVSEAAAEVVRVERGRPRYGIEMDASTIPQEADINERAVSFHKGCYVGQETVARLFYRGKPNRHLRGLRLSGPAGRDEVLRLGQREVGRVASSVESPRLGFLALALVRREASPGETLAVGEAGVQAQVCTLPFDA